MRQPALAAIPFALIGLGTALAAPAIHGIALNEDTKECAGYWGGDEFVYYSLPEGWSAYYPDYIGRKVETPYGSCTYQDSGPADCCRQLGLEFVPEGDMFLNEEEVTLPEEPEHPSICVSLGSANEAGISIHGEKNLCTGVIYFGRKEGGSGGDVIQSREAHTFCSDRSRWVRFHAQDAWEISTPAGTCTTTSPEECCRQLGYTYVSENIGQGFPTGYIGPMIVPMMMFLAPIVLVAIALGALVRHLWRRERKGQGGSG